jgi:hypothetical protein
MKEPTIWCRDYSCSKMKGRQDERNEKTARVVGLDAVQY